MKDFSAWCFCSSSRTPALLFQLWFIRQILLMDHWPLASRPKYIYWRLSQQTWWFIAKTLRLFTAIPTDPSTTLVLPERSQQLEDGLPRCFVQTFMVPRGWIIMIIFWLLLKHLHRVKVRNISTSTVFDGLTLTTFMVPRGWTIMTLMTPSHASMRLTLVVLSDMSWHLLNGFSWSLV